MVRIGCVKVHMYRCLVYISAYDDGVALLTPLPPATLTSLCLYRINRVAGNLASPALGD